MADSTTTTYGLVKPEVGASADTWGNKINADMDALDDLLDGTTAIQPRITGGSIAGITDLAIADGGTGASTAANARTNLGLGTIATQAANAVAITGGSITGITDLAIADGGTGASTAAGAQINLGLGTMATQASSAVSITGGSITGITDLAIADGGTGASTAANARTNLGLGTIATQASSAVSITGGTIDGTTVGATTASTGRFTSVASDALTNTAGTRGPTLTKGYVETVFALTGTAPALNPANGTVQTWTLTANSSPTDSFTSGESMNLMINDGTAFSVTWPSVVWKTSGGFPPVLNATGFTAIILWKVGTTLYGARVGDA